MSGPYWQSSDRRLQIFHGRAEDVLPALAMPDALIVTDPPYGTGGWRRDGSGQGAHPGGSSRREPWDDGSVAWIGLSNCTAVITFWPSNRVRALFDASWEAGLDQTRGLYMHKVDPMPSMTGTPRWSVETIWVLWRGHLVLRGGTDICHVTTPRVGRDREALGHPYQKPVSALLWLIQKTPDRPIIDPFMGSGTTLAAAMQLGRACIGIEADERWCEIAARRLEDPPLLAAMNAPEQVDLFSEVS